MAKPQLYFSLFVSLDLRYRSKCTWHIAVNLCKNGSADSPWNGVRTWVGKGLQIGTKQNVWLAPSKKNHENAWNLLKYSLIGWKYVKNCLI